MRLAGYAHLLRAAERLQWDERAVSLAVDARAWPSLPASRRATIRRFVGGFCVAEVAVAEHLAPFEAAARDPELAACFAAQARDEARHARFFARVWDEVVGDGGDPRDVASDALLELFGTRLPATAHALGEDAGGLVDAVALYHFVLEGIVFFTGQDALLAELDDALPGLREGVERVQADERWHIGLGVHCLATAQKVPDTFCAPLLDELESLAATAWELDASEALRFHRRRLRFVAA